MSESAPLEVKEDAAVAALPKNDIENEEKDQATKIKEAQDLYAKGSRNFLVGSYIEAADELSQVCSIYEEVYGSLSDELGAPYLLYAKILLALALEDNKVVDVPDEQQDDDEEGEDDGEGEEGDEDAGSDDKTDKLEDGEETDKQDVKKENEEESKENEKLVNGHENVEMNGDINAEKLEEEETAASIEKKDSQVSDKKDNEKEEEKAAATTKTEGSEEMKESVEVVAQKVNSDSNSDNENKMEVENNDEEEDVKPSTSNGIKSQEDDVEEEAVIDLN